MSIDELEQCFDALVGDRSINRVLDEEVDAFVFAREVLGLNDDEDPAFEGGDGAPGSAELGKSGGDGSTLALAAPA